MSQILEGKTAVVTGASKGVGKGIALELARNGCQVVVNYFTDQRGAEETVREIESMGQRALAVQGSVAVMEEISNVMSRAISWTGQIDIAVNNAGIQTWKSLLDLEEKEWDRVIDTNLKGCFLGTQMAAKRMMETGRGGAIVNIGSGCNKTAFPHLVDYTASKGGIEMFTKVAACELGRHGIRVNCVAPGAVEIERTKLEAGDYAGTWAKLTPLGRVGTPADVGRAVVFFCSPMSEFVTGQTLWVDGGLFSKPAWPYE